MARAFFCQQIVIGEGGKVEGAKGVMVPDMRAQRENRTRIKLTPPSALSPASAPVAAVNTANGAVATAN